VRSPRSVARPPAEPLHGTTPRAWAIHAGRRIDVPAAGLTIGRETGNDVVVSAPLASKHHARIVPSQGRWFLADLGSGSGTFLNGERLRGEARWLSTGDAIAVGGEIVRFLNDEPGASTGETRIRVGERVTIGRDLTNGIQLRGPCVSGVHAEIVASGDRIELIDRGSRSGTRVNGSIVRRAELTPGCEIGVGPYSLIFDGETLTPRDDSGALRLEAQDVRMSLRGKVLLERLSLAIAPGELVAVIGESGSGKSTLLKVLAGVSRPTEGSILLSGDRVESRLSEIGYLPQDEIVHPRLTVVESLRYSARLRLPYDSSSEEIDQAVQGALAAVSLAHVGAQRVGQLSGGERKRVGLATELLSSPGILFLDEPTTGLDVGLERQMMELFRSLAAVGRHAVVVVTHATHSLDRVDKLLVMGRGGYLCFAGTPAEALEFFAVGSFEDAYIALKSRPAAEWCNDFERAADVPPSLQPSSTPPAHARLSGADPRVLGIQTRALTARYLKAFLRDKVNLSILLLQTPVLGIALLLLFKPAVFGPPGRGAPLVATQLVFLLVMITIWLGAVDASREIVKERAIFGRERAVGVSIGAYLLSKIAVLFSLILLQAAILLGLTAILRPFYEPVGTYLDVFGILAVTGFAAVGMGLLVSSVAQNEDQATALAPVAMTVQLLVGGGIVTVKSMTGVMAAFSATSFGRWAFEAVGTTLHMNGRVIAAGIPQAQNQYGLTFFRLGAGEAYGLLVGFSALFFATIAVILARRKPG